MNELRVNPSTIPGWGIDADPANDPTYPMRRIADQTRGADWPRPAQQSDDVEVLESIEYTRRPAVEGTSTPPSGISGAIRRYAFRRSESDWSHWLLLMGADRINVVEGVVEDLGQGKVPNIPAEMGLRAEWQHNKQGLIDKATSIGLFAAAVFVAVSIRKRVAEQDRLAARATTDLATRSPSQVMRLD